MFLLSVHSITHPGRLDFYISPIRPSGAGDVSEIQRLYLMNSGLSIYAE